MAVNNYRILRHGGGTRPYITQDRTSSSQTVAYLPGEPLKQGTLPYVIALADGDPEVGSDQMVGLAASTSTEAAATTDGLVEVNVILPVRTVIEAGATDTTAVNTQAKIDALRDKWVSGDVTGAGTNGPTGVFTIDENEADDPNVHGYKILGGDPVRGTLFFILNGAVSESVPIL